MSEKDPFGPEAHDKAFPEHKKPGHYCLDWDGLWICPDCEEFECCTCRFEDDPTPNEKA